MYKRVKQQIHFVGIGGIGMSGIAEVLARQDFPVSGSDLAENDAVKRLREIGVRVAVGHRAENITGAAVVVTSSAVRKDNPEVVEAKRLGIPIVPRAAMLSELMRLRYGIAVAGTHGKTTTTSMLANILAAAGEDPTIIVGGKVNSLGGNAKLGQGRFLVAEADESDGSFLLLSPVLTIVTNIDNDHLDHYGQMEKLRMSFLEFTNKVPYYGRVIVCVDDAENVKILDMIAKPVWTYGFSEKADFRIKNFRSHDGGSAFEVHRGAAKLCEVTLKIPGEHNARNATGALAAALELDVAPAAAVKGLASFEGVRRRFEHKGEIEQPKVTIIDDYGHHPTEIAATIAAARQYLESKGHKRLVVAFQPHRFSRTQLCWNEFAPAFVGADKVFLFDVYAAGEDPIEGITSEKLAPQIRGAHYVGMLGTETATQGVRDSLKDGDLLITLGAGSITNLGPALLK